MSMHRARVRPILFNLSRNFQLWSMESCLVVPTDSSDHMLLAPHLFQLLASNKSRGKMVFHRKKWIPLPQGYYVNVYWRKDDLHNPESRGDRVCKTVFLLTCDLPYGEVGHLSSLLSPCSFNLFGAILYPHLPPYSSIHCYQALFL